MSCMLHIPYGSVMDYKLEEQWYLDDCADDIQWSNYLLSISKGIIDVRSGAVNGVNGTIVKFKTEEHKTWFVLRWS
jgi:hypothetical protein